MIDKCNVIEAKFLLLEKQSITEIKKDETYLQILDEEPEVLSGQSGLKPIEIII